MRALLAIVIFLGGMLALNSTADAARKAKRIAKPWYYYAGPPRYHRGSSYARRSCGDVVGEFAGFPCWARKAFSEGRK
jgi:hypothetical protein